MCTALILMEGLLGWLHTRAMSKLRILRLFGNPLEFLPEIIPCTNLRHLSLANVRIEGDQALSTIKVDIEVRFH